MANTNGTPQFLDLAGNLTPSLSFSSTRRQHTMRGVVGAGTVDIQVNINGAGYVSDPSLIFFDQQGFAIPNPNVYPEGLVFDPGLNRLEIRAIDASGHVSLPAVATITVLRPEDADTAPPPPSGLRLRRLRDQVEVVWAGLDWPGIRGYHVYASANPAQQGYTRVNRDLVTRAAEEEESLTPVSSDTAFYDNSFGQLRVFLAEEDYNNVPIQVVQDSVVDTALAGPRIKVDTLVQSVETTPYFKFRHNRLGGPDTINDDLFRGIPPDQPLFYVVTAVGGKAGEEGESAYSAELEGKPLVINTRRVDPPLRTRFEVSEDYISKILQFDPQISVIPGSVTRDVFIDPFATEAERLYFIADFVRRSQSFASLLPIDQMPSYKQALAAAMGLTAVDSVQGIIDDSFDKLAANVDVQRQGSRPAVGSVIFYTKTEPTADIVIPQGVIVSSAGGQGFKVTSRVTLPYSSRQSFYSHQRRQWEVKANIQASLPGLPGNVSAHKITHITGGIIGPTGMGVTNLEATMFGQDLESNEDLATRAILALSATDAGTASGYLATALRRPGVVQAAVVDAGHKFMARDYDEVRGRNIGGKVDVWVQGVHAEQVTDTFAIGYDTILDARLILVSAPQDLIFEVDDRRLTPESPLTGLISGSVKNLRTGVSYDTSGHTLISYNRVQLQAAGQPPLGANDPVRADVRWRNDLRFVFSRQPVLGVNHVASLAPSGPVLVQGVHYDLYRGEDPLWYGESTQASDFIKVTAQGGIPSGLPQVVTAEPHVILGGVPEPLQNLGVHPHTIVVTSAVKNPGYTYQGPYSGAQNPDYFIEVGDETRPLYILWNPQGVVEPEGDEVLVDYQHDENFEVSYTINSLLLGVQRDLEKQRHATADVLAKQVIYNPVDIDMSVVLLAGADRSAADVGIRTNISKVFSGYRIGWPVHQSDIVQAVENTEGVSHVILPFARMSLADGNLVVRESLASAFTQIGRSPMGLGLYLMDNSLRFQTVDGGVAQGRAWGTAPVGVYAGQEALQMYPNSGALQGAMSPAACIIGAGGAVLQGYTDDATLRAAGYASSEEIRAERAARSGNKVLLALPTLPAQAGDLWGVTYQVWGEGEKSHSTIPISGVVKATLGNVTITYA